MLTHGEAKGQTPSVEYRAWVMMKSRCYNKNYETARKSYQDKGITVCERWLKSFGAFLEDMGRRPSPKHSLDRINNSKGYEPLNCRWATDQEQQQNRSNTRNITALGETHCIAEWARRIGAKGGKTTISNRIKHGWPESFAVMLPVGSELVRFD